VSDDQALPSTGGTLAQQFVMSFEVNAPGVGPGSSPLSVTGTTPANGTPWNGSLGYGAVAFSEPINLASFGRYSAMLIPHTGGLTTGGSGYADVPLNAKLAFNPNSNQLIIVPTTGLLPNNTVYLFSLQGISAGNGDTLQAGPVFSTFLLSAPAVSHAARASTSAAETVAAPAATGTPVLPTVGARVARAPDVAVIRPRTSRPAQALDRLPSPTLFA
jgi:hypothetical protein